MVDKLHDFPANLTEMTRRGSILQHQWHCIFKATGLESLKSLTRLEFAHQQIKMNTAVC